MLHGERRSIFESRFSSLFFFSSLLWGTPESIRLCFRFARLKVHHLSVKNNFYTYIDIIYLRGEKWKFGVIFPAGNYIFNSMRPFSLPGRAQRPLLHWEVAPCALTSETVLEVRTAGFHFHDSSEAKRVPRPLADVYAKESYHLIIGAMMWKYYISILDIFRAFLNK